MKAMTHQEFVDKAYKVHEDFYDYSEVSFKRIKYEKVKIICPEHGCFLQNGSSHLQGHGCPRCHNAQTSKRQQSSKETFIVKAKKVHGDTYDYSKVNYVSSQEPVEIVCKTHGSFFQRPNNHLMGQTCLKCTFPGQKEIIARFKAIHGDRYDYSKVAYKDARTKVTIACPKHGDFSQSPHHHSRGSRCPVCARTCSNGESEIIRFVRDTLHLGVKTRDRKIIAPKELDIVIPSKQKAIEFNGSYYHGVDRVGTSYHLHKTRACLKKDIELIHIYQFDWDHKADKVKAMLRAKLGCNTARVFARKCCVSEVTPAEANKLCEAWHLQGGNSRTTKSYALTYKDEVVGVMTFGKPRFTKKADYELLRLCFKPNTTVVGGAGRLFKAFCRAHPTSTIISYANRSISNGAVYKALGFNLLHESRPNYVWIKHRKMLPRYKTQKHKLETLLKDKFDPKKSEIQNMEAAGYHRLFDAGNLVFKYTP